MSRKGDFWNNGVAESLFGTLKLELVFWAKYITRDHAKRSIIDYIERFYNNQRHSCLDYISPMEYESQWLLEKLLKKMSTFIRPLQDYLYGHFSQKEPFRILYLTQVLTTILNFDDKAIPLLLN
jgi:hypothetical protein